MGNALSETIARNVLQRQNGRTDRRRETGVETRCTSLTLSSLAQRSDLGLDEATAETIGCIACDCMFSKMEENDVASSLNFLYLLRGLKSRGLVDESVACVPSRTRIMCRFATLPTLSTVYKNVGRCEGFDHGALDDVNDYNCYDVGIQLAQYEVEWLGDGFEVGCLEYGKQVVHGGTGSGTMTRSGNFDAAVLYVEHLSEEGGAFDTCGAGSTQRVMFVHRGEVKAGARFEVEFEVEPTEEEPYRLVVK